MFKRSIGLLIIFVLFNSCASYESQFKNSKNYSVFPSYKEIEKTFYLIGDAGYSPVGGMSDGLKTLEKYIENEQTFGNYAIFLGDNIYPSGMPPEGHPDRESSEYRLDAQYQAIKDYDGQLYFIPGNHDWYSEGLLGLKREEDYLESKIKDRQVFQPENGCPLKSVTISENIQLIMIDSQWYLEDWNEHPTINEDCEIKSREKLLIEIKLELEKHQNKTILFAMHHPMFTNGTHGGYFALDKHLYPMQKKIPLPILASLVVQIRSQGGVSIQDRYNELYNNLMNQLAEIGKTSDRLVFASGHEHNLQYIEKDGLKQIVSGSGAKSGGVALGKDGLFATGKQGFVVMDVFKDGSSWIRYYVSGINNEPLLVYQKELFPPTKEFDTSQLSDQFPISVKAPIYKQDSLRESLFLKSVWGARYKNAFSTPVEARVARLDTLYGGLTAIREGGQQEYRSLRLKDDNGNIYRMRALGKNSLDISTLIDSKNVVDEKAGDVNVKVPSAIDYDEDFYTATHPYSALAIPTLAKAVDIFYTKPQLFYVPKQKALGDYNEDFGNELYLISNEPTEQSEGDRFFKYPTDIETTDDILTLVRKNEDILVDEQNYIKSRLFDMLIGDWDREADHWRWAEYNNRNGKNVYVPIPRNRDDAFSSFDGNVFDIARSVFAGNRQSHVYSDNIQDLEWFNKEGINLDRALLERSGKEQWTFVAKLIQENLTDSIIDQAFLMIPEEVRDEELNIIREKLKARKSNLVDIAQRYYKVLANLQTITGTDNKDFFEITRLPNGRTNIKTYTYSEDGTKSEVLNDRVYNHLDTRELWVYGLDGNDVFDVRGEDSDLIYLRVIGGKGDDTFNIYDGRRVKIYDHESLPNSIVLNNEGSLILTDLYDLNTYDYRKQLTSEKRIGPAFGYNPDDGLRLGAQLIYTVNSFKRNPFSKRHNITAGYYFDTSSFDLDYEGEFANSIGTANLAIGARVTSPNYTVNYFGYGNETINLQESLGFDYNRVELQTISARVGLVRNSNFGSVFRLQTIFDAITLNNVNNGLFLDQGQIGIDDTNYFASLEAIYNYRSYDNPKNPIRGMAFDLNLGVTDNVQDIDNIFGYLKSRLTFYNSLIKSERLVLKTNIQTQFNFGNRFEFYQGATAGANSGLRGFREERFTGKSSLTASADLRYSFDEFRIELFPIRMGIYGGVDLGRVWVPNGNSEKWHNARGGGVWINSQGGLGGTFSAFNSVEGTRYTFGIGFTF